MIPSDRILLLGRRRVGGRRGWREVGVAIGSGAGNGGAIAGRLWCGYACPQTVWTEVFLWMERWTEGDRAKRMRLDAGPWTREKVLRKGAKHLLWFVFAGLGALTLDGGPVPSALRWFRFT